MQLVNDETMITFLDKWRHDRVTIQLLSTISHSDNERGWQRCRWTDEQMLGLHHRHVTLSIAPTNVDLCCLLTLYKTHSSACAPLSLVALAVHSYPFFIFDIPVSDFFFFFFK